MLTRVLSTLTVAFLLSIPACNLPLHSSSGSKGTVHSGVVEFGSAYANNPLRIVQPHSSFGPNDTVAWVAHLAQDAGTTSLTREFIRVRRGGHKIAVYQTVVTLSSPSDNALGLALPVSALATKGVTSPGTYILRYLRGSTVLAEGTFTLVR